MAMRSWMPPPFNDNWMFADISSTESVLRSLHSEYRLCAISSFRDCL
jgi:hypothetical protein